MHFDQGRRLQRKGTLQYDQCDRVTHIKRYQNLVEAECRERGFHHDNTREVLPLLHRRDITGLSVCAVMAGFGFSPQDIFQGIAVAKRICEAHFVRERRAGTHETQTTRSYGTVTGGGSSPVYCGETHDCGNLPVD
jgi:hypothetical protein